MLALQNKAQFPRHPWGVDSKVDFHCSFLLDRRSAFKFTLIQCLRLQTLTETSIKLHMDNAELSK